MAAGGILSRNPAEVEQLRRLGYPSLIRRIPLGVDLKEGETRLSPRRSGGVVSRPQGASFYAVFRPPAPG